MRNTIILFMAFVLVMSGCSLFDANTAISGPGVIPSNSSGVPMISSNGIITSANTFENRVTLGQLPGVSRRTIVGNNIAVPNTPATVWTVGGIYVYPDTQRQLNISSTSGADNISGTGARVVFIEGLDADYNVISETLVLNGLSPVTTVNSYYRVNSFSVVRAGTRSGALGNINAVHPVAGTLARILAGENLAQQIVYTVPAGMTAYITNILATTGRNDGVQTTFRVTPYSTNVTIALSQTFIYQNDVTFQPTIPLALSERTDFNARGINIGSGSTSRISMLVNLITVNNTVLASYPFQP